MASLKRLEEGPSPMNTPRALSGKDAYRLRSVLEL